MAVQYAPLFSLETQFQAKDGSNNTAGWLKVYLAATDDPAETYSDYLGTRNPEKIVLDDNGRAVVICDKAKAYRLEVYDADGMLLWTEEPVYCSGTGGGGVAVTQVTSTDGSIDVQSAQVGSRTIYDLSLASDSTDVLEWAKAYRNEVLDGDVFPVYSSGTMQTQAGRGLEVFANRFYHVTNSIEVVPTGNGILYETVTAKLMIDYGTGTPTELYAHVFDVDNSVSDKVEIEFSVDIIPEGDGFLYWNIAGTSSLRSVGMSMQVHRIYSGINAVPGSIASKAWVIANFSGAIPFSALEYDAGIITAISGSAIAGGGGGSGADPAMVSAIASSYASSAASSKLDASASSMFQPSGNYQPSGDYAYNSSLSSKMDKAESSSFYPMTGNPSGFLTSVNMAGYATTGDLQSAVSGKLDSSAFNSGDFYSTSNPSGFITGVDLSNYATTAYVDSAVSGKLDSTAAYTPTFGFSGDKISSIDGSALIGGGGGSGGDYSGIQPVNVNNIDRTISVDAITLAVDGSSISAEIDNQTAILHVIGGGGDYVEKSAISAQSANWNEVSAKLDTTAFSNVSGTFLTAVPDGYATTSYVDSSVSGKLDSTAAYTPTFGLNDGKISSIDGYSLDVPDEPDLSGYVSKDQIEVAIGFQVSATLSSFAQGREVSAYNDSFAQGYSGSASGTSMSQGFESWAKDVSFSQGSTTDAHNTAMAQGKSAFARSCSFAQGNQVDASDYSFAQGNQVSATSYSFAQGSAIYASGQSFAQGKRVTASSTSFAQGQSATAYNRSFAQGYLVSAINTAVAFGTNNLKYDGDATADNVAFVIGDGTAYTAKHDLINITKDGEITTYSATADTAGFKFRATIENKLDKSASSDFYSTSNPSGFITGMDLSNYATTSYVDSSVSNKLDSTASAMFQPSGNYQPSGDYLSATESANYYSTANPSGFIPLSALGLMEI